MNVVRSEKHSVKFDIPQGPVLGPLFIFFVNYFPNIVSQGTLACADDNTYILVWKYRYIEMVKAVAQCTYVEDIYNVILPKSTNVTGIKQFLLISVRNQRP